MKHIVNLIQLAVVAAIIFPMFYVWDTDKVDNFCEAIKPGLSKAELLQRVDDANVKILGPEDVDIAGGKWNASIVARTPFIEHSCLIKGVGHTVATAKIQ